MHFAEELADPGELNLPPTKGIGQKELTMAESLIESMSGDWEPEKYKDEYREALMRVIEEKIKSGGMRLHRGRRVQNQPKSWIWSPCCRKASNKLKPERRKPPGTARPLEGLLRLRALRRCGGIGFEIDHADVGPSRTEEAFVFSLQFS